MDERFATAIRTALERDASFDELVAIVRAHRDAGLTQPAAYDALIALRPHLAEPLEDRLLDLMDLIVGWCHPSRRIWRGDPLAPR